jgi:serine/threonine-protein kinase
MLANAPCPSLDGAHSRIGEVVCERWRLDECLGAGGMGTVFAATHRNGMRVAIKIMHAELCVHPELKERFFAEARIANAVAHPGVIGVLDEGVSEHGEPLLVMELLKGQTLLERFEYAHDSVDLSEALAIAEQLLDVLAAAHDKGILHRDVKPENVFLTEDGRVKLLDFGVARVQGAPRHTAPGAAVGTPSFMAPEQARGRHEEVDHRSDLWSVGATLFWLLTGELVHGSGTANEQLVSAMTRPAPKLLSLLPNISPHLAAVIDRALAFEPHARFPDARAMQHAVRELRRSLMANTTLDAQIYHCPPIRPSRSSSMLRRFPFSGRPAKFAAAALVLLGLGSALRYSRGSGATVSHAAAAAPVELLPVAAAPVPQPAASVAKAGAESVPETKPAQVAATPSAASAHGPSRRAPRPDPLARRR